MFPAALPSRRRIALLCLAFAVGACERAPRTPPDSTAGRTSAPERRADHPADWPPELGPALIVPADSDQAAVLLHPATALNAVITGAQYQLVTPGGDSSRTSVTLLSSDAQVCGEAPVVRLGDTAPRAWTAGLLSRRARLLPMDSIEAMPAGDSARMVADLARLASALPGGSDARFMGLPFVVVGARRFASPDRLFLVAHLVRRIPQEATPLEERVFFVAEQERSTRDAAYAVAYHLRSAGTEETAEHYDVLAALRGESAVYMLLTRDQVARTTYELLERTRTTPWRVRWARALEC